MLAAKTISARPQAFSASPRLAPRPAPRASRIVTRAGFDETNFFLNVLLSGTAGAAAAAVATVTSENRDAEIERIQTVDGALPIAAAIVADATAHSIPGLNILFGLLTEPLGAACGVAYLMTLVLSSPAVDPTTLAPKGTIINAEKAADSRGKIRVPFTRILPTALKVVDTSNQGSSGAGWTVGPEGLPRLPVTSVLIVVGVGSAIVEAASHAPVLSLFLPRVLQVAFWLAAAGFVLDKRE